MYTTINFNTKKQLKEAVAMGREVNVYQPNDMFGSSAAKPDYTGQVALEGPHYPEPHKWYATGHMVNGKLVKVT